MDKLHFVFFVKLAVAVNCVAMPMPLLICPPGWHQTATITSYYNDFHCNGNENVSCTSINMVFPSHSVIIVHRGEWQLLRPVLNHLSTCGVKVLPIDITERIPQNICTFQTRIILSITSVEMEFIQKEAGLKKCTFHNYTRDEEDLLNQIMVSCPSTLWLFGNQNCRKSSASTNSFTITRVLVANNVVTVAVLKSTPFVDKHIDEFNKTTYSGLIIEMLAAIGETYNLNFKFVEPQDKSYGSPYNGTSWNGFIGMLQRNEVDLVAADLTITYVRQQVADFSFPFYHPSYGILIQLPQQSNKQIWTIIYLFQPLIWMTVLLSIIFASPYIHLLPKLVQNGTKIEFNNLTDCVWYIYSGLVNQGGDLIPKSFSTTTFLTFWWIYAALITAIYSSCLIAIVTKGKIAIPFKTMAGLVDAVAKGNYKVCINSNTSYQTALFNNNGLESKTLKRFFQQNPTYLSNDSGCIDKLLNEPNVALISQTYYLESVQNQFCLSKKLILLNDFFNSTSFGLAFRKNSTLKDVFSNEIFKILDSGMMQAWEAYHSDKRQFCNIINPNDIISMENRPLRISEISGVFILFLIGIIFSIIYFGVEWKLWGKIKHKSKYSVMRHYHLAEKHKFC